MTIKKIITFLFLVIVLIPLYVKAETCDNDSIILVSVDTEEKSAGATELNETTIEDNKIKLNIKLLEVDDYVKYKLVLRNDSTQDYNLDESISNSDNTISYTIETLDNNKIISPGEEKEVYLVVKYKNRVDSSIFQNGSYNKNEELALTFMSKSINNPETSYEPPIKMFVINLIVLVISIILYIKTRKELFLSVFVIGLFLIPSGAYSVCTCKVNIESEVTIPEYSERELYNVIKQEAVVDDIKSEHVLSDTGVDFLEASSEENGEGVYIFAPTKNDTNPVYYYRGLVDDNNVLFGNYCWKILRTTESGGIKLIYNGVPTDGKCLSEGAATQIAGGVKYNASYSNLRSFGYNITSSAGRTMKYKQDSGVAGGTIYANDVTYEDGMYILSEDRYIKDENFATDRDTKLTTHHYTCFKTTDTGCTSVNFIYMTRGTVEHYVVLTGGEKIEDVISSEVTDEPNDNKSDVRKIVDNWYQANMTEYTNYLDDVVWCNDRSMYSLGGWGKNGDPATKMTFNANYRVSELGKPSLTCTNPNDRFTTSEETGNGKLEYPIGLITLDEADMAGFAWYKESSTYLSNGQVWWTMSPSLQSANYMYIGVVHSMTDNVHTAYNSGVSGGVRPVIALKNIVKIAGGDGTKENPFTIEELP